MNNWLVCTVRGSAITCPSSAGVVRAQAIPGATLAALGLTVNPVATTITTAEAFGNPFIIRNTTRVRDFEPVGETSTNVESFYVGDDWKFARNFQLSFGIRWDYQQSYGNDNSTYLKFNDFRDNAAPRLGFIWDSPETAAASCLPTTHSSSKLRFRWTSMSAQVAATFRRIRISTSID